MASDLPAFISTKGLSHHVFCSYLVEEREWQSGWLDVWLLAKVNPPHSISLVLFLSLYVRPQCVTSSCPVHQHGHPFLCLPFSSSLLICSKTSWALFVWYVEIDPQKRIDISGLRNATRFSLLIKLLVFLRCNERLSYWQTGVTVIMS